MEKEKNNNQVNINKAKEQEKPTTSETIIGYAVIALITLGISACCNTIIENTPDDTSSAQIQNKNLITKADFQGEWAFKSDSVNLYCEKLSNGTTGARVMIDGKNYAITRNLEDKYNFLPYNLWADAKVKIIECEGINPGNKCEICNGVSLDNVCKVSLTDTVTFADTLCN